MHPKAGRMKKKKKERGKPKRAKKERKRVQCFSEKRTPAKVLDLEKSIQVTGEC
jgi:hypothetical protein